MYCALIARCVYRDRWFIKALVSPGNEASIACNSNVSCEGSLALCGGYSTHRWCHRISLRGVDQAFWYIYPSSPPQHSPTSRPDDPPYLLKSTVLFEMGLYLLSLPLTDFLRSLEPALSVRRPSAVENGVFDVAGKYTGNNQRNGPSFL